MRFTWRRTCHLPARLLTSSPRVATNSRLTSQPSAPTRVTPARHRPAPTVSAAPLLQLARFQLKRLCQRAPTRLRPQRSPATITATPTEASAVRTAPADSLTVRTAPTTATLTAREGTARRLVTHATATRRAAQPNPAPAPLHFHRRRREEVPRPGRRPHRQPLTPARPLGSKDPLSHPHRRPAVLGRRRRGAERTPRTETGQRRLAVRRRTPATRAVQPAAQLPAPKP